MIAIIGAMEEEVQIIRGKINRKQTEEIGRSQFTSGEIGGKKVVLLKSGIGKVNAAMATTILIERFKPDLIINTGSAGGLNNDLDIGDIVVSSAVRHHDVDATAFGYEYGQVPQMPASFTADPRLAETAMECAKTLDIKTVQGLIATGDSFMSDPDKVFWVKEKFPDLEAVEMEAAAIAQVAYQYCIPYVIIRSLSDIAGKASEVSFDQFLEKAAKNSAALVLRMVDRL